MLFFDVIDFIFKTFIKSVFNIYFPLILMVMYYQYDRYVYLEEKILGRPRTSAFQRVFNDLMYGLVAGFVGSFIAVWLGVAIDQIVIILMWPLALILVLVNARFVCFSYAGAIVALGGLFFGWDNIYAPSIFALVGIIHLMESLLIWLDGYQDRLPVLVQNRQREVVGAFSIQKFWPLPIALLVLLNIPVIGDKITMPEWWPLLRPGEGSNVSIFAMAPLVAALGYNDVAITQTPKERAQSTAFKLGIYSLVIIGLAYIASKYPIFSYIGAFAMPILHEVVARMSINEQRNAKPIFMAPSRGLMVLDVLPSSPAEKMGLSIGDTILSINGQDVNSEEMMNEILKDYPNFVWVDGTDIKGRFKTCEHRSYPTGIKSLGAIIISKRSAAIMNLFRYDDPWSEFMEGRKLG